MVIKEILARAARKLIGPDGVAVDQQTLTGEQAEPTLTGVRSPWRDSVAKGLDPAGLAKLLQDADQGDNLAFLTLCEEMEERDPHYHSVLGQRKRAVSLIEPIILSPQDGKEEIADAVKKLVNASEFSGLVSDLLDGIAKGYACVEPVWELNANAWTVARYKRRDPRFYQFDTKTGEVLRIREDGKTEGVAIPPYSTVVHIPKIKSGLPVRGGLARTVMWSFLLKSFTLQDWAAFLEVFGMPLRVGKYDDQAGPDEKRTLLRAVRDLGTDAAAIIPRNMEVEFIEAKGGQGNAVFGAMADYLDKQISKAVIGQTMTTDDGSSLAQASVHEEVKIDIRKSDAREMQATLQQQLIEPFVAFNFGVEAVAPQLVLPVEDPEDVNAFADAVSKLVPVGYRIKQSEVHKRMGTTEPEEMDAVLQIPQTQPAEPALNPPQRAARAMKGSVCPRCGVDHHLASSQRETELDALIKDGLGQWREDMTPLIDQITAAVEASSGYEDFLARLDTLDPDMASLAKTMAIQAMKARGNGDIGDS